ncbi:MAG: SDR family NAD(P)-dependent oxidoreductase [Thermodesulfobacteriota bacterium]
MKKFKNKIVLITGASSGIGAETSKEFAIQGAKVLLLARNEKNLQKVANEIISNGGEAEIFPVDVSDYNAVQETTEKIKKDIGVPDIIFNNAGGGKWRFIEETDYKEAVDMISVPYLGAFFITKAFMPEMLKRNTGHIVNMTSLPGFIPFSGATGYIASRKAMIGLHEALTADLYGTGVKTSLSYFAKVETPYWQHNPESEERLPTSQKIIPVISAKKAAQTIVRGVAKGKRKISAPFMIQVVEFLTYLTPFITRFIMDQTGYKRK